MSTRAVFNGTTVSALDKTTADNDNIKGPITWDDATWILTSAFIIFTMQSGFGLLEAGAVASKNQVNILVKNVVDVVFGGMTYWMFGYALSFGEGPYANPFCGMGDFFVDASGDEMGLMYATFVFQLSFATTATTIVSGAMAERTHLTSYIVFSFLNVVVYCIPAHWVWSSRGFLAHLGAVDFAGSGVVHLVGACSALVATLMLKPRTGRYDDHGGQPWPALNSPVNAIMGTFMLWWGWLAFNCGSTFGISGGKWKLASKAAFTTILASMSGGITGIMVSVAEHSDCWGRVRRFFCLAPCVGLPDQHTPNSFGVKKGKYDVSYLINSILGALVAITASCPLVRPYEAVIIGVVGALCTLGCAALMDRCKVDDPVGAVAVHGASGAWGMLAVGLFVVDDNVEDLTGDRSGVLKGGGFYLLGVQVLTILCEVAWSMLSTFLLLLIIDKTIGLRVSLEEERLGADYCEHGVIDYSLLLFPEMTHPPFTPTPDPSRSAFFQHDSTSCLVTSSSVSSNGGPRLPPSDILRSLEKLQKQQHDHHEEHHRDSHRRQNRAYHHREHQLGRDHHDIGQLRERDREHDHRERDREYCHGEHDREHNHRENDRKEPQRRRRRRHNSASSLSLSSSADDGRAVEPHRNITSISSLSTLGDEVKDSGVKVRNNGVEVTKDGTEVEVAKKRGLLVSYGEAGGGGGGGGVVNEVEVHDHSTPDGTIGGRQPTQHSSGDFVRLDDILPTPVLPL